MTGHQLKLALHNSKLEPEGTGRSNSMVPAVYARVLPLLLRAHPKGYIPRPGDAIKVVMNSSSNILWHHSLARPLIQAPAAVLLDEDLSLLSECTGSAELVRRERLHRRSVQPWRPPSALQSWASGCLCLLSAAP
jgi:hypothetical protein